MHDEPVSHIGIADGGHPRDGRPSRSPSAAAWTLAGDLVEPAGGVLTRLGATSQTVTMAGPAEFVWVISCPAQHAG